MPEIPLPCGRVAMVSPDDFEWAAGYRWQSIRGGCRQARGQVRYAKRRAPCGATVRMHREIAVRMGLRFDEIDHVNGNGLDNRRENLRPATRSQNTQNRRAWSRSGFRGVYPDGTGNWLVQIKGAACLPQVTLGRYADPLLAAAAYNIAARILHGEYARLNDVPAALEAEALAAGGRNLKRMAMQLEGVAV